MAHEQRTFTAIPWPILTACERNAPPLELYNTAMHHVYPSVLGIVCSPPWRGSPVLGAVLQLVDRTVLVPVVCVAFAVKGLPTQRVHFTLQQLVDNGLDFVSSSEILLACLEHLRDPKVGARRVETVAAQQYSVR